MLRHEVSIQAKTTSLNTYGQASTTGSWTTEKTVRAHIETLSGRELDLARQVFPTATRRVTIEYLSTMDSTGATQRRVLFGSRALYIGHIDNPEFENWHLELLCGESV